MKALKWISFLLGCLLVLSGCMTSAGQNSGIVAGPRSSGMLTSGRYETKQGTLEYRWGYLLHRDGTVTETQSIEGTDKFADFWREKFPTIVETESNYKFTKEEDGARLLVKAQRTYNSVAELNDAGGVQVHLVESPLFRSVNLTSQTGSFDPDNMVQTYGENDVATQEDWTAFLKDAITIRYSVEDEVTGQVYNWTHTAGEVGSGMSVVIQAKQWRPWAFWGGGVIGVFLLFVVYMGLFGRRYWEPREVE